MDCPGPERPIWILVRDLLVALVLAVGLFVIFAVVNVRLLHGFMAPEVLLLEVGAIVPVSSVWGGRSPTPRTPSSGGTVWTLGGTRSGSSSAS
jgi:hypothetical protein